MFIVLSLFVLILKCEKICLRIHLTRSLLVKRWCATIQQWIITTSSHIDLNISTYYFMFVHYCWQRSCITMKSIIGHWINTESLFSCEHRQISNSSSIHSMRYNLAIQWRLKLDRYCQTHVLLTHDSTFQLSKLGSLINVCWLY
jgi:hypothetical protein